MANVMMIVPSQGKDAAAFANTAAALNRQFLQNQAAIFRTILKGSPMDWSVEFKLDSALSPKVRDRDFWSNVAASEIVAILSHSGMDGPALAVGDYPLPTQPPSWLPTQPWKRGEESRTMGSVLITRTANSLNMKGMMFWSRVGTGRTNRAKIILFGCRTGGEAGDHLLKNGPSISAYGQLVANVARLPVFGFEGKHGVADLKFVAPSFQLILKELPPTEMIRFDPR